MPVCQPGVTDMRLDLASTPSSNTLVLLLLHGTAAAPYKQLNNSAVAIRGSYQGAA